MSIYNKISTRKLIFIVSFFISFFLMFGTFLFLNIQGNTTIDKILETSSYEYLPKEAKNYIKKVYNETGEILLTEKNKKYNTPYLNPDYVDYLVYGETSSYGYIPSDTNIDYNYEETNDEKLPSKFNLQNVDGKSYVTSMKDQKSFGLCWDFAATGALESKILKSSLYESEIELDLSERQIDYATSGKTFVDIGINPYYNYSKTLGNGGNIKVYLDAVMNGVSPILELDWNYDYYYIGLVKPEDIWDMEKIEYDIDGLYSFSSSYSEEKINAIKKNLMEHGTSVISIGTSKYASYTPTEDEEILVDGKTQNRLYYGGTINHEVQVIGWDDNYRHNICTSGNLEPNYSQEDGTYTCASGDLKEVQGAWIIKNQWGTTSASAYAYVPYDNPGSKYSIFTDVSIKNWENVYNKIGTSLVSFNKQDSKEKINKIKFYVEKNDVKANVYVSTTGSYDDLKLVAKKDITYSGLYTVDLSEQNIILDNNKFSIRVTDEDGKNISIYNYLGISAFTTNVTDEIKIDIDDVENKSSLKNHALAVENNVIVLNGTSRGLKKNKRIDFKIVNGNGLDVTNKFTITRNYEIGNYINSIISFKNDVPFGTYNVSVFVDGAMYDNFKLDINCYTPDLEGKGTQEEPFIITNPDELNLIRTSPESYYKLGNDIDLKYDTTNENGKFYNEGSGWEPIKDFKGGLDGDGHKITGLYINRPNSSNQGLFSNITYTSNVYNNVNENVTLYIKNIIIEDFEINAYTAGALAGNINGSSNIRNTIMLENIIIKNGVITATGNVGGISSNLQILNKKMLKNKHISNLYNDATIISNNGQAGGLFGFISTAKETDELNVSNVMNMGNVISNETSGGLYGSIKVNDAGLINISNGFNYGNIKGNVANEIVGLVSNSSGSSAKTGKVNLNNIYYVRGVAFNNSDDMITVNNVELKTIPELKKIETYFSWQDFNANFSIKEIDGITRIPILNGVDFDYTDDIIDIELYKDFDTNIYNYIFPNKETVKNIEYSMTDETIATIDESGNIVGKETGSTTLNVLSYYDGYEKSVKINVKDSPVHYTVIYDANNGVGSMLNQAIQVGVKTKLRSNLYSKENYIFKEWNTKQDGTGTSYSNEEEVLDIAEKNSNITLYAIWTPAIYIVEFNSNGGTGTMEPQQIYINESVNLNKNLFKKENSVFIGWNTKSDGTGDWYYDEQTVFNITDLNKTITLYAIWAQQYTILFDSNDGTNNTKEQEAYYDFEESLMGNPFKKTGYLFKEWNTKPDGTGTSYKNLQVVFNLAEPGEVIRLYAIWQINYISNIKDYEFSSNYLSKIPQKTTVNDYSSKITLKRLYKMKTYDQDGNELSEDDYITTGSVTKIIRGNEVIDEFYNVVLGDLNSDGFVTKEDLKKIFDHAIGDDKINEYYYLKAADVNYDGVITITDVSKVLAYIFNNILSLL